MYTLQETFDIVARHLLTQNERSMREGDCVYRGPNGLKCAVGILITDEDYREELEHQRVDDDDIAILLKDYPLDLLSELQQIHDAYENTDDWPYYLKKCAESHSLEYKEHEYVS